jgi:3-oxoacyl-[acyl-carrier protein] reductase
VIQKMTDDQWSAIMDVHVTAPFRILRAAADYFRETSKQEAEQGREVFRKVVNISSVSGVIGNAGQANYSAGKAAINGLTKALAKEWGRYKVNVNSVAFGLIKTRLTEAVAGEGHATIDIAGNEIKVGVNPQLMKNIEATIPLGRGGTPAEAAGSVYLLHSGIQLHHGSGACGGWRPSLNGRRPRWITQDAARCAGLAGAWRAWPACRIALPGRATPTYPPARCG